ncbi:MmcQ/YjbR family DNA-binding protein [Streptomonospora litoralis]|uniref:MmcQ/YjbR family DNA-binding protein n=1 Tax=Streptomonospora litoralis TaxID=2498135 RepID=A0A4P6QAE8_9ACTN|nr:MmcQ/YjbR family DNA-binding protein [Streptomonospora litoralis]QBI56217.1 hypothetical protein EKD16_22320 [Streptomonospora litoralis]
MRHLRLNWQVESYCLFPGWVDVDITAGYHMNKRHWITLAPGDSVDTKLVEELVTESYRLVLATLPRSRRPIAPEAVGA